MKIILKVLIQLFFLKVKYYNYPNSIKEQIRNADCEELEVLREKFKFKNNKYLKPLNRKKSFLGIGPSAQDSVVGLGIAVWLKRRELKCRKKLKEAHKLTK